jgi:hypothetical protein
VLTRSPPLGGALAVGLAVDLATTPDLASVEHLLAVVIGIGGALLLRDRWPRSLDRPGRGAVPTGTPHRNVRREPAAHRGVGVSTRVRSDSTSS